MLRPHTFPATGIEYGTHSEIFENGSMSTPPRTAPPTSKVRVFVGDSESMWEVREPKNLLHDQVAAYLAHAAIAMPDILESGRSMFRFQAMHRARHGPTKILLRYATDGLVSKAVMGTANAREVIKTCWNRLIGNYQDTAAVNDLCAVRNLLTAHFQESKTKAIERKKLEDIATKYAGDKIFPLLEQATSDLVARALVLVSHPKFDGQEPRARPHEHVGLDDLLAIQQCLAGKNLF